MFTSNIKKLSGTERDVHCPEGSFRSIRAVVADDGLGFSVHKTMVPKGNTKMWHYTNHMEACYCISGGGILENLDTGQTFKVAPDIVYVLDNHDRHIFRSNADTVLISVFNPPCVGDEVHDENGSYKSRSAA